MFLSLFRRVEERRKKNLEKEEIFFLEGSMAGSDWASAPVTCHSSERAEAEGEGGKGGGNGGGGEGGGKDGGARDDPRWPAMPARAH